MNIIFLILIIIIWAFTIYFEIKNKERGEKIFYTFYLLVISVIIFPFFKIFDSLWLNITYIVFYSFLLHSIYTDFEIFTILSEIFLIKKHIDKTQITKIDFEFTKMLVDYYKNLCKTYTIKVYPQKDILMDYIKINIWIIVVAGILLILMINKNVIF